MLGCHPRPKAQNPKTAAGGWREGVTQPQMGHLASDPRGRHGRLRLDGHQGTSFALPIDIAVAISIPAVLGAFLAAIPIWAGLFALLAVWELAAYLSSPRQTHPTLSSIA